MGHTTSVQADGKDTEPRTFGFTPAEYAQLVKSLSVDEQRNRVELGHFVSCFPSCLRSLVQPLFFHLSKERLGEGSADWSCLAEGLSRVIRSGLPWRDVLEVWADAEQQDAAGPGADELELYLELAVSLCFWSAFADRSSDSSEALGPDLAVAALHASVPRDSLAAMASWLEGNAPMLPAAVGPNLATLTGGVKQELPLFESHILEASLQLLLRSCSPRLWESEEWMPLFRDWRDGRSFNALLKGALYYEGPAILLIQTQQGHVLGALSTVWMDSNGKFSGSTECFVFAVQPAFRMCRSTSTAGNHFYLNSRNKYAPRGVGFGGQVGFCRLWLDADFEECYVLESDATYAKGLLLPSSGSLQISFQVAAIEVWGCGGPEAAQAQRAHRERIEGVREQARKVDKARLCENDFDKEMFLGNTFSATAGSRADPKEDKERAAAD